jgi:uncharacterized protein with PIN domain
MIDWLKLKPKCSKCNSTSIEKTVYHKQAYDPKSGQRREYTKWKCKDCKNEYWK